MCLCFKAVRKSSQSDASRGSNPSDIQLAQSGGLNVNDEYANAFRSASYAEFWNKVENVGKDQEDIGESSSSPFHYYEFLAEHILEPDKESINALLQRGFPSRISELYSLISDYFVNSAEASKLCGALLKNIEQAKINYRSIKNVLDSTPSTGDFTSEQCRFSVTELHLFVEVNNPFAGPASQSFQSVHDCYAAMLRRLELHRNKILRKVKMMSVCKNASVVCLVAASTAIAVCAVVIASHALVAIVAGPVVLSFPLKRWFRFESLRLLRRQSLQLDAAVRGAYILNKDFDTMSRLVTKLHDEVEHDKGMIRFCLQRKDERHPLQEVVRRLRQNDSSFNSQLDELEKHVYLCLMTINKARMLVVSEIQVHQGGDRLEVQHRQIVRTI